MRQTLRTGIVLSAALALAQEDLVGAIGAFLGEHQRCGELDGGLTHVTADTCVVWVSCSGCGAGLRRWFEAAEEPKADGP